ncbi:MAG: hypothetical protein AAF198_11475 [Pseudomonadota bacterium]
MKYIAPIAAAALAAAPLNAGSLDEPVVESVQVAETGATNSAAWIIPLVAVGLVALAVSGSDDDDDDDEILAYTGG